MHCATLLHSSTIFAPHVGVRARCRHAHTAALRARRTYRASQNWDGESSMVTRISRAIPRARASFRARAASARAVSFAIGGGRNQQTSGVRRRRDGIGRLVVVASRGYDGERRRADVAKHINAPLARFAHHLRAHRRLSRLLPLRRSALRIFALFRRLPALLGVGFRALVFMRVSGTRVAHDRRASPLDVSSNNRCAGGACARHLRARYRGAKITAPRRHAVCANYNGVASSIARIRRCSRNTPFVLAAIGALSRRAAGSACAPLRVCSYFCASFRRAPRTCSFAWTWM